jgi:hypothetical protein
MTAPDETTVVIMDIFGRQVARKVVTSEKTVIDLRQLLNGIYFYSVEKENIRYPGKIIIQR